MGNLVLKFNKEEQTVQNNEIYTDISLFSYPDKNNNGGKMKISKSINIRAVQNSIDNIFSFLKGERILDPEFGTDLYKYIYEGINQGNEELIAASIRDTLNKYEPRVNLRKINNISTIDDTDDNTVVLDIEYYINGLTDEIFHKQYEIQQSYS